MLKFYDKKSTKIKEHVMYVFLHIRKLDIIYQSRLVPKVPSVTNLTVGTRPVSTNCNIASQTGLADFRVRRSINIIWQSKNFVKFLKFSYNNLVIFYNNYDIFMYFQIQSLNHNFL